MEERERYYSFVLSRIPYEMYILFYNNCHHHHQPINVPTAGAQAFLMDDTKLLTTYPKVCIKAYQVCFLSQAILTEYCC
jgi:hypothetical protein